MRRNLREKIAVVTYQHKSGFATSRAYIPLAPSLTANLPAYKQQPYLFACSTSLPVPSYAVSTWCSHTRDQPNGANVCRDRRELFSQLRRTKRLCKYLYKQQITYYSRNGLHISKNLLLRSVFAVLLQVAWDKVSDNGVDIILVYATTPDRDTNTYQSSKAVLSGIHSSTEVCDIFRVSLVVDIVSKVSMYQNIELSMYCSPSFAKLIDPHYVSQVAD